MPSSLGKERETEKQRETERDIERERGESERVRTYSYSRNSQQTTKKSFQRLYGSKSRKLHQPQLDIQSTAAGSRRNPMREALSGSSGSRSQMQVALPVATHDSASW